MKTNNLSYNVTKFYVENGITYKMNVRISLGDCCKNGVCDWSITADIYEKRRNGRFVLKLTDEERTLIENRIKDGYYTSEAIQARKDQKKREEYEKKRNEIIADCEKSIQEAENKKLVMLAVLDAGISLKNAIYYNHSNELAFNWNDYETKVTQEQFDEFIKTVDKTKLPKNITFKLK